MQMLGPRPEASDHERRRYSRYALRCRCWLESAEASVFGPTADVGLGGLFLRTAIPLAEGQRVQVSLQVERKPQPIVADAVVTRAVRAGQGMRHGVGVEFLDIVQGRDFLRRSLGTKGR
jgi:hypothetical protein